MLEGTLFNLVSEISYGEFALDHVPRQIVRSLQITEPEELPPPPPPPREGGAAYYAPEITAHLLAAEAERSPSASAVTAAVPRLRRAMLVDWCITMPQTFERERGCPIANETIHLAVALFDRFVTARTPPRSPLSFTGALWRPEFSYPHMAAAFFVAAKYEEQKPPRRFEVADVAHVDGARGGELLLELEGALLRSVDFRLAAPTAYTWARTFWPVVMRSFDVAAAAAAADDDAGTYG